MCVRVCGVCVCVCVCEHVSKQNTVTCTSLGFFIFKMILSVQHVSFTIYYYPLHLDIQRCSLPPNHLLQLSQCSQLPLHKNIDGLNKAMTFIPRDDKIHSICKHQRFIQQRQDTCHRVQQLDKLIPGSAQDHYRTPFLDHTKGLGIINWVHHN